MMARFCRYVEKVFHWNALLERLRDSRQKPQIPTRAVFTSVVMLFATRLGSLNALEEQLRVAGRWKSVVGRRLPSADSVGRIVAGIDSECLRDILSQIGHILRRNKVLDENPWSLRFVALDGHEFFSQ